MFLCFADRHIKHVEKTEHCFFVIFHDILCPQSVYPRVQSASCAIGVAFKLISEIFLIFFWGGGGKHSAPKTQLCFILFIAFYREFNPNKSQTKHLPYP